MPSQPVRHATVVVERSFHAPPARVFAAWANPIAKARWSAGPADWRNEFEIDFRVGGRETYRGGPSCGPEHGYDAIYRDVVPDQRIVYTYDMRVGLDLISVSLVTVQFAPEGIGTQVIFTEQVALLSGPADATVLERHNRGVLDSLATYLRHTSPATG
jgi:uncharacterized protein YndB with AHSA1/START domain